MKDPLDPQWRALLDLVSPIHQATRRFARRIARSNADGDDLFHEALLRARDKLPTLRDPARFRAWFHQVLLSVHRSRSRRSFWRRLVSTDAPDAVHELADPALAGDGGAHWEERASAQRASRALATLPAPQREAIVLHELEEYSVEEIAEMQLTSVSSVKSRLARGRERLRRFYIALYAEAATADPHLAADPGALP